MHKKLDRIPVKSNEIHAGFNGILRNQWNSLYNSWNSKECQWNPRSKPCIPSTKVDIEKKSSGKQLSLPNLKSPWNFSF